MLKNKEGFTLIEVIVAIVILGVLCAIAIPYAVGYQERAGRTVCETNRTALCRDYHLLALTESNAPTFDDFKAFVGDQLENACPTKGTITGVVNGGRLILICSIHGEDSSQGSIGGPVPTNTRDVVYVFDPVAGRYIAITVHDTGLGQAYTAINGRIIYYDGEAYPKGYYYIAAWQYSAAIKDMDAYIKIVTKDGQNPRAFVKMDINAPAQVYDAATQTGHYPNANNNTIIQQGQCYYVDFDWDNVSGPVLALYNGAAGDAGWRGDLGLEKNKGVWTVLEVQ